MLDTSTDKTDVCTGATDWPKLFAERSFQADDPTAALSELWAIVDATLRVAADEEERLPWDRRCLQQVRLALQRPESRPLLARFDEELRVRKAASAPDAEQLATAAFDVLQTSARELAQHSRGPR